AGAWATACGPNDALEHPLATDPVEPLGTGGRASRLCLRGVRNAVPRPLRTGRPDAANRIAATGARPPASGGPRQARALLDRRVQGTRKPLRSGLRTGRDGLRSDHGAGD